MIYKFDEIRNLDLITLDFINSNVTENEFINYLNNELINEGLLEDFKFFYSKFKEKVIDIFYTFLVKAYQVGFSIFDKINIFFKWLFNRISIFREKHPLVYKMIVITIIVMVILIITAASAKAQSSGQVIPKAKIDMAIGWLDHIKSKGQLDNLELSKAIAHLIDLRDGKIDIPVLGDKAIKIANAGLNTAQKIMDEAKTNQDQSLLKFCAELIEKGQNYIKAVYKKTANTENIRLLMK
jgi:hypothetical protein